MKSAILLTTALFLASAPAPDSQTISELSAGFLAPLDEHGLMAAEPVPKLETSPEITPPVTKRVTTQADIEESIQ